MATPQQLRSAIARLTGLAQADLRALFSGEPTPDRLKAALTDVLPALVEQYGVAAAALAAEWYDQTRLEVNVRGVFSAEPVAVPAVGAESLAGYAVGSLYRAQPDYAAARSLVDGGLQRRIANVARDTVMQAAIADPQADGWQRTGSGSCAFCAMLIGRGAVYTERTADFASHDHCSCGATPAFKNEPRPVRPYTPSSRNISEADRERVRKYLRTH